MLIFSVFVGLTVKAMQDFINLLLSKTQIHANLKK